MNDYRKLSAMSTILLQRTSCKFGALLKVSVAVQAKDGINNRERVRPSATVAFIQSAFILAASMLYILCPLHELYQLPRSSKFSKPA